MFLRHNALGISWAILILILCGIPGDQFRGENKANLDVVIHAVLFAVLFLLLTIGFIKQRRFLALHSLTKLKVLILCTVYGGLIELMQGFLFVGRSVEFSDVLANAVGAGAGLVVFMLIYGNESYT